MTLPDLDTSQISCIAFWDATNHGASSIDPEETTSAMDAYNLYSNGVDGQITRSYANRTTRAMNVRVKDDGWMIAWLDRTETSFSQDVDFNNNTPDYHGDYDWMNNLTNDGGGQSFYSNNLARVINTLRNELSNTASTTFNYNDVGFYNYRLSEATNLSAVGVSGNNETNYCSLTPNSEVTIAKSWAAGATDASYGGSIKFEPSDEDIIIATGDGQLGVLDTTNRLDKGDTNEIEVTHDNPCGAGFMLWWS